MHRPNAPVSLADLAAAGIRLRPYEAVTIVRELATQVARGEVAGVPSPHVIRLSSSGTVSVEGPVAAGGRSVVRAAQLLDSLLPASDAGSQFKVPGGLKLIVARALGTLDLPPFATLEALAEALDRFAATDPKASVTNLVVSWAEFVARRAPEPVEAAPPASAQVEPFVGSRAAEVRAHLASEPLTVSDIRRARRATGLALAQVAERSRIPMGLLRQLEWGYLANWPAGHSGRTQLARYAVAAGLDEQLVVRTIAPMIEEIERARPAAPVQVAAAPRLTPPERAVTNIPISPGTSLLAVQAPAPARHRRRALALAALAIPALLAIGLLPGWWAYSSPAGAPDSPRTGAPAAGVRPVPANVEQLRATGTSGAAAAVPPPVRTEALPAAAAPSAARRDPVEAPAGAPVGTSEGAPGPVRDTEQTVASGSPETGGYRLAADRVAFSPSFASVGTAVFYHAEAPEGSALVRADTTSDGAVLRITRIVDDSANNFHVRPSPDGSRIAFDSDREGIRGVYVADADGKHVKRVSSAGFAAVPSWSPDGGTLAFVRAEAARPQVWNLWTLELASGELRQVTRHAFGQPWGGSWFPDGRRIAYSHEQRLVVRDLQTDAERVFQSPVKGRLVRTPAVSPDGRRIIFQVRHDGAWLLELGNGSMRRVLEDATAEEYTWSPDGKRVAYHSRKSGAWGVWVMAPR